MKPLSTLSLGLIVLINLTIPSITQGMIALSEQQLSRETGQALFNLSYIAPSDNSNLMKGKNVAGQGVGSIGFYKLGMEADIEVNTNVRNLQLGCGGVNGAGICDLDIKNLSLSGSPTSYDSTGSPIFANGRAATSAKLTNPFIQFAIKNPGTASTREVVGFRLSADQVDGLLTAGLNNNGTPSTSDGIQRLSGFMRIGETDGLVTTKSALFGKQPNEVLKGYLRANIFLLGSFDRTFTTVPSDSRTLGVTIPSVTQAFTVPETIVNGQRMSSALISNVPVKIPSLSLTTGVNQVYATFPDILLIASSAKVALKDGSAVKNVNLSANLDQSLSMVHNLPLSGNGIYLSLQNQSILWPDAYIGNIDSTKSDLSTMSKSDVAQKGWWLSLANPIKLGTLKAADPVDITSIFPQMATLISNELMTEKNRIAIGTTDALRALANMTVTTPNAVVIDLNNATSINPVNLSMNNLKLTNQEVSANCWGNLKFC